MSPINPVQSQLLLMSLLAPSTHLRTCHGKGGSNPTQNMQGAVCSWPNIAIKTPSVQTQRVREVWLFPLVGALMLRHTASLSPFCPRAGKPPPPYTHIQCPEGQESFHLSWAWVKCPHVTDLLEQGGMGAGLSRPADLKLKK